MKDPYAVLLEKQAEMDKLRAQAKALLVVIPLLDDQVEFSEAKPVGAEQPSQP